MRIAREKRMSQAELGRVIVTHVRDDRDERIADVCAIESPAKPDFLGVRVLDQVPLGDLATYIDWSPFFMAWELKGKYPEIFNDAHVGKEAKDLFDRGQALLRQILKERTLRAHGVYGFFPANSVGDDVVLNRLGRRIFQSPRELVVDDAVIRRALKEPVLAIVEAVMGALERTSPELAEDIIQKGVYVAGGGSLLAGLPERLTLETGLKFIRAADPLTAIVRGAGIVLENFKDYQDVCIA